MRHHGSGGIRNQGRDEVRHHGSFKKKRSDALLVSDKEQSDEELIEEEINHNHESPLINAQTK